jgi:hypothetical protein
MPTKRTMSQLYAFFQPGQSAGAITPDRVQDLLFSLQGGWGSMSTDPLPEGPPAATVIDNVSEWKKAVAVTGLAEHSQQFTMPANNRLQCVCPVPSLMEISATVNVIGGNNKTIQIALAKNDEIIDTSSAIVRLGAGGDTEEATLFADFLQAQNDYVEVWVRNLTDATNITVTRLNMRARTYVV